MYGARPGRAPDPCRRRRRLARQDAPLDRRRGTTVRVRREADSTADGRRGQGADPRLVVRPRVGRDPRAGSRRGARGRAGQPRLGLGRVRFRASVRRGDEGRERRRDASARQLRGREDALPRAGHGARVDARCRRRRRADGAGHICRFGRRPSRITSARAAGRGSERGNGGRPSSRRSRGSRRRSSRTTSCSAAATRASSASSLRTRGSERTTMRSSAVSGFGTTPSRASPAPRAEREGFQNVELTLNNDEWSGRAAARCCERPLSAERDRLTSARGTAEALFGASSRSDSTPREARPERAGRGGLAPRMAIGSVVLALLVGAAFAVLLLTISDLRASGRLVTNSRAANAAADRLEERVVDLESGARGFVITRQERFLEPWQAARAAFPTEVSRPGPGGQLRRGLRADCRRGPCARDPLVGRLSNRRPRPTVGRDRCLVKE